MQGPQYYLRLYLVQVIQLSFIYNSPAVKAPILGEACIRVRIKYVYCFMTFGPY